jgi:hypothetical protein
MKRDQDAPRRLSVCPDCHRNYVVPLDGDEHDALSWWLVLRCGWCGARRDVLVSDEEAFELCEEVDRGLSRLSVAADRLQRQRREAEIETFAAALQLDLIGADDFGSPTNRPTRTGRSRRA